MSVVPLRYRPAELLPGEVAPPRRRLGRIALWTLAADVTFAFAVVATLAVRAALT